MPKPINTLHGAFKAAAKALKRADYETPRICSVLSCLRLDGVISPDITYRAKRIIENRLWPHVFYENWVKATHPEVWAGTPDKNVAALNGRINWCKSLAKEFKNHESRKGNKAQKGKAKKLQRTR